MQIERGGGGGNLCFIGPECFGVCWVALMQVAVASLGS